MSFRDEIKTKLDGLPYEYCQSFAARSALRVLPLMATNVHTDRPFWYWKNQDKAKQLLSVMQAVRFSFALPLVACESNKIQSMDDFVNDKAAFAALNAAKAAYASYSTNVARSADAYTAYAVAKAASAAANVADFSAASANSANAAITSYYRDEMITDLNTIVNNKDFISILYKPLWKGIPEYVVSLWQRFQEWTKELDAGFEVWLEWYQDRLYGTDTDLELLKKQVNVPAEIWDQGVKAVNGYLATLSSAQKQQKELQPLNRVRAIFIGNGAAGKTSLIRALHGESVVEGKEK